MKPKYSRFRSIGLPAMIIIPAMSFAYGGVITPEPNGDVTVTSANNGANTVLASGGTDPAPVVTVQSDVDLTSDALLGFGNAIRVTAPNYTIFNDGNLSGSLEGIFVDTLSSNNITIDNAVGAIIRGQDDGIYLDGDGGEILNSGSIFGQGGASSDGIEGFSFLFVDNEGLISGNSTGIFAVDFLTVFNAAGASITGNLDEGIYAFDDALIDNFGAISSATTDAIVVLDDAQILNSGTIIGAENGIFAGTDLFLDNEMNGVIAGQGSLIEGNILGGAGPTISPSPAVALLRWEPPMTSVAVSSVSIRSPRQAPASR